MLLCVKYGLSCSTWVEKLGMEGSWAYTGWRAVTVRTGLSRTFHLLELMMFTTSWHQGGPQGMYISEPSSCVYRCDTYDLRVTNHLSPHHICTLLPESWGFFLFFTVIGLKDTSGNDSQRANGCLCQTWLQVPGCYGKGSCLGRDISVTLSYVNWPFTWSWFPDQETWKLDLMDLLAFRVVPLCRT